MAKKTTPSHAEDELPPAMDYAMHNATYEGFGQFVKWSIIALAVLCVSLYCFIEAGQPILGTLLLLALPIGAVVIFIIGARR